MSPFAQHGMRIILRVTRRTWTCRCREGQDAESGRHPSPVREQFRSSARYLVREQCGRWLRGAMEAVRKALWFIEAHFASELTLQEVAECAAVSRFYLLRAFGTATGMSIMQYVRARRLSQ